MSYITDSMNAILHEEKRKKREKRLAIFGILLSGLGWFGTGYQLDGLFLGLGMGFGSIMVMAVCVLKIESESRGDR